MKTVRVGVVGAGFITEIHLQWLRRLAPRAEVVAIAGAGERCREVAVRFGIPHALPGGYRRLLEMAEIDVVDVCVPNHLHEEVAVAAAQAGKHVMVEKPLTGYFGVPDDPDPVGRTVPRARMLVGALASARRILEAARRAGVQVMYAENFVYAPPVAKLKALLARSKGPVLELRAEESHSGSHAAYARRWRTAGGGALLRLGAHPIGAVLHLKRFEGQRRAGHPIRPAWVTAEVGELTRTPAYLAGDTRFLAGGFDDVEDWAVAIMGFEDGSKATVFSTDVSLGGVKNRVEAYLADAVLLANINPNPSVVTYTPAADTFGDEYLAEKLETKAGWSFASPDEDWMRGYPQELEDFIDAVATGRPAVSDGELGLEVVRVVYAAYLAAEQGRRVDLRETETPAKG